MNADSAKLTILVVDDDPIIRRTMARLLRSRFEVIEAATAAAAKDIIAAAPPALVLTDLHMSFSGYEGHEVADFADAAHVPCLVVTGSTPDVRATLRDRTIAKPFDVIDLNARVDAAIRART